MSSPGPGALPPLGSVPHPLEEESLESRYRVEAYLARRRSLVDGAIRAGSPLPLLMWHALGWLLWARLGRLLRTVELRVLVEEIPNLGARRMLIRYANEAYAQHIASQVRARLLRMRTPIRYLSWAGRLVLLALTIAQGYGCLRAP